MLYLHSPVYCCLIYARLVNLFMGNIIVIARLPGIYCDKSLATRAVTVMCPIRLVRIVSCHGNALQNSPWKPVCLTFSYNERRKSSLPLQSFCLDMCDWTGCIGAKVKPQAQHHLPIPHPQTNEQFEFANNDTLQEYSKGLILVT